MTKFELISGKVCPEYNIFGEVLQRSEGAYCRSCPDVYNSTDVWKCRSFTSNITMYLQWKNFTEPLFTKYNVYNEDQKTHLIVLLVGWLIFLIIILRIRERWSDLDLWLRPETPWSLLDNMNTSSFFYFKFLLIISLKIMCKTMSTTK